MAFKGNCKECGKPTYLHKGKCKDCTTPEEMKAIYEKKKEKNREYWKKYSVIKKQLKPTGEAALFETIWNTRPRISFINGESLQSFTVDKFAHVLPKGVYKLWKLNEKNIVLMTVGQHHRQHNVARSILEKEHPGWIKFFKLQDELREEYNRIFKCIK